MSSLKGGLLKVLYKLDSFSRKLESKGIIRIIEKPSYADYDDIAKAIRAMIVITRKTGNDTVLIKTIDGKYYYIIGCEYGTIVPDIIHRKMEVEVHVCKVEVCDADQYTLTGEAILGIPADTIKKIIIIGVCDSAEFFKIYSLREEKRGELKKYLEEVRSNENERLELLYGTKPIDHDDILSKFFEITTHNDDIETLVKQVFQIETPSKFDEVIQHIKNKYSAKLLNEHAEEIRKAIENILNKRSTPTQLMYWE